MIYNVVGLGTQGDGYIISDAGTKVFIPGSLPGDQYDVPVSAQGDADLNRASLCVPSAERAVAACVHFQECGSCQLQHMSGKLYQAFKKQQVVSALHGAKVPCDSIADPVILGPKVRRRVVFKAAFDSTGVILGFFKKQSHTLVDIHMCLVVTPAIQALIAPLKELLLKLKSHLLPRREIYEIAIVDTDSGMDMDFDFNLKTISFEQNQILIEFARQHNIARISHKGQIIVAFKNPRIDFNDVSVGVESRCFLQASKPADQALSDLIQRHSLKLPKLKSADLFCGRGTLTVPLLKLGSVDAFEQDVDAIQALQKSDAQKTGLPLQTYLRDLHHNPLSIAELKKYHQIVLNPPRIGAFAQTKNLAGSPVQQIIYVSCNPQSFARDAAYLCQNGFQLKCVVPVDQFHWSVHTEIFAIFHPKLESIKKQ